jgi:hypothetical protein
MDPDTLPAGVALYLRHVASGQSLRSLAREQGCHASTILRQVRKQENRRDDILVDRAMARRDSDLRQPSQANQKGNTDMTPSTQHRAPPISAQDQTLALMHYLQHLSGPGALLVVASEMPKAVIMREDVTGQTHRLAILDRELAEDMALRDWIRCTKPGRVACYGLTAAGSAALRLHQALTEEDDAGPRRGRYGQAESPVSILARRRDKDGMPFLSVALVHAAERMHEDFVTAGLSKLPLRPVDAFVTELEAEPSRANKSAGPATLAARHRVVSVLQELGPGLGDVVLRCCCHLEGVETAEAALGWSARSGKIVLRIALHRLRLIHDRMGDAAMMIG